MSVVQVLVALVLMAVVACRGSGETQARRVTGSTSSLRDASADAAGPAVDATSDAGHTPKATWPVAPGAETPEFGCIGWSRQRGLLACILGTSFSDSGLDVSLELLRIRPDAEPLASLALVDQPGRSLPDFPPDKIASFNDLLRGFTPLDRGTARLETRWDGDRLVVNPRITSGGATLELQLRRDGTKIVAPRYHATLWLRVGSHPRLMIEELDDAISHVEARLIFAGEALIVERIYSVGDEGTYGTFIQLWRCTADHCEDATAPFPAPPPHEAR